MDNYFHAPYYADQTDWKHDDFYQLNRYLSRLFTFAARRMEEIQAMDLSQMTDETKVLICIIIRFQNKKSLFELDNLAELRNIEPLKEKLNLVENPMDLHDMYKKYNVGW